ncbi:MAG: replication restart DNA helicase PriA [Thermosynechococcaceae cyanobacterium MS004]|nr:replication restart DNA helicase PriA [Thermosynechococcaceae cyanobacterium MS004]
MTQIETIRCPNCGRPGERHHIEERHLVRTQCPECDYLMVTCSLTGKVIEAYAPGLSAAAVQLHRGRSSVMRALLAS